MPPLTLEEQKEYYATQGSAANPLSPLAFLNQKRNAAKPVSLLSSEAGADKLASLQQTQQRLSPLPTQPTDPAKPAEPTKPPAATSFMGPNGEELTSTDKKQSQKLVNKGYNPIGGELQEGVELDTANDPVQMAMQQSKQDFEDAKQKLMTLDVSQNPQLQRMLMNISSQWDARIADMERTNVSRQAALGQRGLRTGSAQHTASFGGIMAAEEREAVSRIAQLESQKQSALLEAQTAFETKEFEKYAKFVDIAEKEYERQIQAVVELNKQNIEQEKLRMQQEKDEREALESYLEEQRSMVDDVAFGVSNLFTGDEEQDMQMVTQLAELHGIDDPAALYSAALETKTEQEREDFQALSGKSKEYASALRTGAIDPSTTFEEFLTIDDPEYQYKGERAKLGLEQDKLGIEKTQVDIARGKVGIEADRVGILRDKMDMRYKELQIAGEAQDQLIERAKLGDNDALNKLGISTDPSAKVRVDNKEAAALNKDFASNGNYQAVLKSQDAWRALKAYEEVVNERGAESLTGSFVGGASKSKTAHETATLVLKEFYNLGVLNGPDEAKLNAVLPSNVTVTPLAPFKGSKVKSAIEDQKKVFEDKLDTDYLSVRSQFGKYDPSQVTMLEDLDRRYLQTKAEINPDVQKFITENPDLEVEEVLQVINTRFK